MKGDFPGDWFWNFMGSRIPISLCVAALVTSAACDILRTTRVGVSEGVVEHPEGDGRLSALTLSMEPFAGMAEDEDAFVREEVLRYEILSLRARLEHASEDIAANERAWSEHVCAEHIEPEHSEWWRDESYLLWLSGFVAMICGFIFRKPLGAAVQKVVGRGGPSEP